MPGADWVHGWRHALLPRAVAISVGYFAYDTYDMGRKGMFAGPKGWEMVAHHTVLVVCCCTALLEQVGITLLNICLLCEFNSVWLHARSLFMSAIQAAGKQMLYRQNKLPVAKLCTPDIQARLPEHVKVDSLVPMKPYFRTIWRMIWGMLWTTMFITRVPIHIWVLWKVSTDVYHGLWPSVAIGMLPILGISLIIVLNYTLTTSLRAAQARERKVCPAQIQLYYQLQAHIYEKKEM